MSPWAPVARTIQPNQVTARESTGVSKTYRQTQHHIHRDDYTEMQFQLHTTHSRRGLELDARFYIRHDRCYSIEDYSVRVRGPERTLRYAHTRVGQANVSQQSSAPNDDLRGIPGIGISRPGPTQACRDPLAGLVLARSDSDHLQATRIQPRIYRQEAVASITPSEARRSFFVSARYPKHES